MLAEPITISGKIINPSAQARPAAITSTAQGQGDGSKGEKSPDLSEMAELVADLQRNLNMIHEVHLSFTVHQASGEIMVTVKNESTGEVIREIPPSELLNLAAKIDEMIGIIFDQQG
ncbi:MAG: flagellar protein FlaG [Thermodesulfobacteriota bacterium]